MEICSRCGEEFDLEFARRSIGQRYGAGTYDNEFPDGDICDMCAREEIGTNYSAGAYIMSLMPGHQWD